LTNLEVVDLEWVLRREAICCGLLETVEVVHHKKGLLPTNIFKLS